jgi:nitroreductase
MKPTIKSEYPILDVIKQRWSTRAYTQKELNDNEVNTLFEAARWAASCFNEQPWRFVFAKHGTAAFDNLLVPLVEFNQNWAKNASLLVYNIVSENFEKNNKVNAHAEHDLGLALGNLTTQATAMGLNVHLMAGLDFAKAKTALNIPDGYKVVSAMAIGYVKNESEMSEEEKKNEFGAQQRKPLTSIISEGSF